MPALPSSRVVIVSAILLAGTLLSAWAFVSRSQVEDERRQSEFTLQAERHAEALQNRMDIVVARVQALQQLHASAGRMEAEGFARFVRMASQHPRIQAYEWIPRVTAAERTAFEASASAEGLNDYVIRDIHGSDLFAAPDRPEYFPVRLIEPIKGNTANLGVDLGSEVMRNAALVQARDSGKIVATAPVVLIQGRNQQRGILIVAPCFAPDTAVADMDGRRRNLQGFAAGVVRLDQLFEQIIENIPASGVDLRLRDAAVSGEAGYLLTHWSRLRSTAMSGNPAWFETSPLRSRHQLILAGRDYTLDAAASPAYLDLHDSSGPLLTLLGGLTLTLCIGAFAASQLRHRHLVTQTVELRTAALQEALLQLSHSEEHYRSFFERLRLPILTIDPSSGDIQDANSEACSFYGHAHRELCALNITAINQLPIEETHKRMQQALSGETQAFHLTHRLANGEMRQVEVFASPIESHGQILLYSVVLDITRRKRAEALLRMQSQAVDAAANAIVITDREGRIERVNLAFSRMTGYAAEEALGRKPGELLNAGHHPREFFTDLWETILSGRIWHGELRNRRKDGSLYDEDQTIAPVIDEAGKITHFVAIKQDITIRKQAEAALIDAKHTAEAANLAKSRFLATMSHEIRTPLNGILGMAQMLLQPRLQEDERRNFARTILNSGQTLLALLNDILDLSKVEAGKLELASASFSPRQILDEISALFAEAARLKGLELEVDWRGAPGLRYRGDPIRLRQMLSNLISNALKFTSQGKISIRAEEVSHTHSTACLSFAVSDTGIGISPDKQTLLFRPFTQIDNSDTRQHGGTGLGLSIVRSLAHLMQGEVGVNSREGMGTTFWFRIQVVPLGESQDSRRSERPADSSHAPSDSLTGRRVLIVEDNATNLQVVEAMLARQALHLSHAANGLDAVERIARGERFDLILMDCQMPVMDGFAATRRIRQIEREERRPPVPIIALTAGAYADDRQHCDAAGMSDFLAKPVDFGRLLAVVRKWILEIPSPSATEAPTSPPEQPESMLAPDSNIFDQPGLLRRLGGDLGIARLATSAFLNESPQLLASLLEALQAGKAADARRHAHSIKGAAANTSGQALAICARRIEAACSNGQLDEAEAMLPELEIECERFREALQAFLAANCS